jgi:exodeoxyribonuclease VII large subunit
MARRVTGKTPEPLTVSQITTAIKQQLESSFADVWVTGELSRVTRAASGHVYLTLKDEGAVLQAVIWRGVASALRFELAEGMEIVARGNIDVYPPRGSYQLIISRAEPRGLGALQLAFRQLLEKLEKEGLFREELKKPLPAYPSRIGVITSPTGAAIRDIVNVVARRFPAVTLYLMPSRVQGAEAAGEIARALDLLNRKRPDLDVLIVGRGGGSLEDLWPFNEETVARAIHRSAIPVVSAVGHEIDFSISDFVADVRAATPTEAAEIVVPDRGELRRLIDQRRERLALALERMVTRGWQRLEAVASRHALRAPEAPLRERAQRVDDVMARLRVAFDHRMGRIGELADVLGQRLEALSPLKVLGRGYSVTFGPDGRVLRSVESIAPGDRIRTRLQSGAVVSEVRETRETPNGKGAESED